MHGHRTAEIYFKNIIIAENKVNENKSLINKDNIMLRLARRPLLP